MQVALLAIGASNLSLWAHPPTPRESIAFPILLCGQITLLGLYPPLASSFVDALVLRLFMALPFEELAGLLSNTPQTRIFQSLIVLSLWMIALAGWQRLLAERISAVAGLATLYTVGGVIADYLHAESLAAGNLPAQALTRSFLPTLCAPDANSPLTLWAWASAPLLLLLFTAPLVKSSKQRNEASFHFPPQSLPPVS